MDDFSKMQISLLISVLLWQGVNPVVHNGAFKKYNHHSDITIHKVSLTQKGYIQFLRYIAKVPALTDYTFCIWVKSNNLTYSHPLLSYSKDEKERLIRVWLSPKGTHINLELMEVKIFSIPLNLLEHHWYHICQSWSPHQASWSLYLNGKLKSSGHERQLKGLKIKGGGDIVVGQEYTDFDKGLDDGIEGDIYGFNFVLSSADPPRRPVNKEVRYNLPSRRHFGSWTSNKRVAHVVEAKSTGLRLVELGFNCVIGRGAPVSGKDVLVSWTKTPVRVFGGALLKNVSPFCA